MAWRKQADPFPAPLRAFREEDWPPVEGECLGCYACRDAGYDADCVSLGGPCGWRFYAAIADYPPGEAALLTARNRRADAVHRWAQARLNWLGEDHPDWAAEWIAGWQAEDRARYGRAP